MKCDEPCPTCHHVQSGHPEGYCECLVKVGAAPDDLDVCACTDDIHSDHPHEWEQDGEFGAFCVRCSQEQEFPAKLWQP